MLNRNALWAAVCLTSAACSLSAQSLTCRRVDVPAAGLRAEGLAELLSDVVLDCTGGTPTAAGAPLPQFEVIVVSSTTLANRVVPPPKAPTTLILEGPLAPVILWNDTLLLVDDPAPARQAVCLPEEGAEGCPAKAGTAGPNVFQGKQLQNNAVIFRRVPIDPPGAGKTRRLRITNLRANATKIPLTPAPRNLTLNTQVFDSGGRLLPIDQAEVVAGVAAPGVKAAIRTADDTAVAPTAAALLVTPAMIPQNNPGRGLGFNIKFTEGFASAFRRRSLATSGADPTFLASQAEAGARLNTESGFFNGRFPDKNNLNLAGLADSGTRLKLVLSDIPDNVFFLVSVRDVAPGTTNYSTAPRAILSYTDENGYGPFLETFASNDGFTIIRPANGVVTLAWEVVSSDPDKVEEISFNIRLFAPNGVAQLGTATYLATLAPIHPGVEVQHPPTIAPVPAFMDDPLAEPQVAFRVVPTLSTGDLISVSAATYSSNTVAPESLVSGFARGLAPVTEVSGGSPAVSLAGSSVNIVDFAGVRRTAPLLLAAPNQVNYVVNAGTAMGDAVVSISNSGQNVAIGYLKVVPVAPGLFSANGSGQGLALGEAVLNGRSTPLSEPVDVGADVANTFVTLYGTGFRGRTSLTGVRLQIGGVAVPVSFAGPHAQLPGVDQVSAGPLPLSLRGRGEVPVELVVDGKAANALSLVVK